MIIEGKENKWEIVCGLEIHCQIISESKIFSGASTKFGADANENVSFVDAGMPGMLPICRPAIRSPSFNIRSSAKAW